jgi:TetR/AcrR family transcriptional regulator, transcriptional repressor for nem operon
VNETAQKLMDLAEAHIRDAGYRGFSFRDLAAELGIKSASVHHHFPTKVTLAAAVVRRYADRFLATVAPRPNETAEDAISAYRWAFRKAFERDGRMCLCGVLGAEAGVLAPEVVGETQSFFRRCIDDLTRRIGGSEAEARAFHVMATLEGGMMLARAYRDIGAFDQAVSSLTQPPLAISR